MVDRKLGPGAHAAGWRVREATAGAVLWERSGASPSRTPLRHALDNGTTSKSGAPWVFVAPDGQTKYRTARGARHAIALADAPEDDVAPFEVYTSMREQRLPSTEGMPPTPRPSSPRRVVGHAGKGGAVSSLAKG
jgi:hypothetical protein